MTGDRKLFLLHVPGADWQVIQPIVDAGRMPNLERIISGGTIGTLFAHAPMSHPILTTNIATGCHPAEHGVQHILMEKPEAGYRLANSRDVAAARLWDIAAANGLNAAAIGWPLTHPTRNHDPALVVSDAFAMGWGATFDDWPLAGRSVSDPDLHEVLSDLRLHPSDLDATMMLPFLPEGRRIDMETDQRAVQFAQVLSRIASVHGAATWVAEERDWNLLAVHFEFVERLTTLFGQFRAPRMGHVTQADFDIYRYVVDGAYLFLDLLIGRYLELIPDDVHVMIVSAHGSQIDEFRPVPDPDPHRRDNVRTYREMGIIAASGPGIRRDELLFGALGVDVVPTALAVLGLDAGEALPGKVLNDLFADAPERRAATLPEPVQAEEDRNSGLAAAMVNDLGHAGYFPQLSDDAELSGEQVWVLRQNNKAMSLMMRGEAGAARDIARTIIDVVPDNVAAQMTLVRADVAEGRFEEAGTVIGELRDMGVRTSQIDLLAGRVALNTGDAAQAEKEFAAAIEKTKGVDEQARVYESIGVAYQKAGQADAAIAAFELALRIKPTSAPANAGMGRALAEKKRHEDAVDYYRRSLGTLRHQVDTLCNLGQSYLNLNRPTEAAEAFRTALDVLPGFQPALNGLKAADDDAARSSVAEVRQRMGDD